MSSHSNWCFNLDFLVFLTCSFFQSVWSADLNKPFPFHPGPLFGGVCTEEVISEDVDVFWSGGDWRMMSSLNTECIMWCTFCKIVLTKIQFNRGRAENSLGLWIRLKCPDLIHFCWVFLSASSVGSGSSYLRTVKVINLLILNLWC